MIVLQTKVTYFQIINGLDLEHIDKNQQYINCLMDIVVVLFKN